MPPGIGSCAGLLLGRWPVITVALVSAGLVALVALAPPFPGGGQGSLTTSRSREPNPPAVRQPPPIDGDSPPSAPDTLAPARPREVLRPGDSGRDVRRAQALLKSLGYALEVNGVFDESTRKAVVDFQGQQGLRKDGLIGPDTRRQLESAAFWHTVSRGETLWDLARTFGTTVELLMEVNDLAVPSIRAGQRLLLPVAGYGSGSGDWGGYTVKPGDTLAAIAARFHVSEAELARLNRIPNPDLLRPGQRLELPGDLSERVGRGGGGGVFGGAAVFPLAWPLPEKGRISSGFGWRKNPFGESGREFHEGIDIAVRPGTPVLAAASGVVVEAGWMGSYGYGVVIEHGRGVQTLYGHNARVLVQPGQRVDRGQTIALSGSSGRSTGPHLDFRVRVNGRLVNPLGYVRRP